MRRPTPAPGRRCPGRRCRWRPWPRCDPPLVARPPPAHPGLHRPHPGQPLQGYEHPPHPPRPVTPSQRRLGQGRGRIASQPGKGSIASHPGRGPRASRSRRPVSGHHTDHRPGPPQRPVNGSATTRRSTLPTGHRAQPPQPRPPRRQHPGCRRPAGTTRRSRYGRSNRYSPRRLPERESGPPGRAHRSTHPLPSRPLRAANPQAGVTQGQRSRSAEHQPTRSARRPLLRSQCPHHRPSPTRFRDRRRTRSPHHRATPSPHRPTRFLDQRATPSRRHRPTRSPDPRRTRYPGHLGTPTPCPHHLRSASRSPRRR
ncbi:hypothetical protein GA0070619_3635 [Micromonospora zamorensis]|nr:hypothetical protein GA0070619_3635 [Micromonospora zamorensis]